MTITELSIKRPPLVIVIFTVLAVLGYFSYNQLRYELIPDVTPPYVTVMTNYPGGSPNEVETSITKVVEDAVSSVDKIKNIQSSSFEGVSFVFIEFTQSADVNIALQNVQRKVGEIVNQLPSDAKSPVISKFSLTELPILRMGVTADMEPNEFYQFMKDKVKPQISKLAGVGQVTFAGGEEREIKINLDLEKLNSYNIPVLQVLQAIKTSNMDFPVGKIKDADGQYIVRVSGKFSSLEELKNLIVSRSNEGGNIKLQDVAEIEDGTKEAESYARLNGKSALGVLVQKQTDANAVEVSRLVHQELKKIEAANADKRLKFDVAQDLSSFTLDAARAVNKDLMIAVVLVAIVMLVFLHSLRNSVIVMVAIPASLVSTFIGMYAFGFSLNLMTLLALSLVIGILVDDSIVVLENIYRHMELGKPKKQAALEGRNEIGFAALSITLVDVVVFLPLALIQGLIGDIVRQFALVVVVSTLLSLFVSFTITPMLASRFTKLQHLTKDTNMGRFGLWVEKAFDKLTAKYTSILKLGMNNGWKVIAFAGILLVLSIALIPAGFIGSEFMPPSDRGELSVILELPERINLEETNLITLEAERMISKMPEVKKVFANAGASSEGFIGYTSNSVAELNVSLVPKTQRSKSDIQVSREIKEKLLQIPSVKPRVSPIGIFGSSDMAPIALLISGPDFNEVETTGKMIKEAVRKIPGTADVRVSSGEGKPETRVEINREKMAAFGIGLDQVAATLRVAFTGDDESKFRQGNDEYDIRVVFDRFDRNNTSDLGKITFMNSRGERIELSQFANIYQTVGPTELSRKNRTAAISLLSQAVGRPSGDIAEDIKKELKRLKIPSNIEVTFEGDVQMQEESFGSLFIALMVGILFVYLIMVALYNSFVYPFIVLFSIPVAIVGALLAMGLFVKSLNIFSILGIIMLVGLVGKNAILLVDRTNQMRSEGMPMFEALIDAGQTRLRPILMTTFAMVFGMLPIAISMGASSELKSGLATALIGGLISSLLLTLVLVPVVYIKVEHLKVKLTDIINRFKGKASPKEKAPEPEFAAPVAEEEPGGRFSFRKMIKGFSIFMTLIFIADSSSSAQEQVRKLTLKEAVAIAMEQNRELKVAYFDKEKNEKKVKEAYGNAMPTITGSGQYARNLKLPVFYMPSFSFDPDAGITMGPSQAMEMGLKNNFTGTISAEWPLYQGAIYAGIRAAKIVDNISSENIVNTRAATITEVKKAYFNVLIVKEQYNLISQSIKRGSQALKDARLLFGQGLASELDTLRAFVAVENLKPALIKTGNGISIAKSYLVNLLGLPANEIIEPADSLTSGDFLKEFNLSGASIEEALNKRPELSLLDLQIKANDELINAEVAGHMPTLAAFGQLQTVLQADNYRLNQRWPASAVIGLNLSVPIFSGFKTEARIEQARIEKMKLETQFDNLKALIATDVKVNTSNVAEAFRRIEAQTQTVKSAERSYELTRSRWLKGLSRQNELFDAELALTQAKTNYLQAIYDYLVAGAELEKALGRAGR
ncbi:MAG: TolC family protein [Ignavibacteria bacterium]|jgi:hydrophobe/amphiphile efflux-1 (HAE1) family protein|nr:TolC family protein [Ignavibacteria bacterium]MCU7504359.1 TolC family protein [Ignavibacteria bacterium]MCU7517582.1 TolC family protein [Ignavibacteria bacterium]